MSFHEVRFPASLSFASSGGIERRTEIVTLANGFESRNTPWEQARRRYDAGLGVRALDDIDTVLAFFEARRGRLHGFRWKDWLDHRSGKPSAPPSPLDQAIGAGDGETAEFQLVKRYGTVDPVTRPIVKPVAGTLRVALDGVEQPAGAVDLDAASGIVHFADPPPAGAAITAGFEFDVPVRFDTDRLEIDLAAFEAGAIPSIPIVEIRL